MTIKQPIWNFPTTGLTEADNRKLSERWITAEIASNAGLRRVDSNTARLLFARRSGDLCGIVFPNVWPGEEHVREYRLRLDKPEREQRIDGTTREIGKYLHPPGRGNLLYVPIDLNPALLHRADLPIVITEGEFKTLALW